MVDCFRQIQQNILPMIGNSGHAPFSLGSYHGCLSDDGMDFYLIILQSTAFAGPAGFVGTCFPKSCPPDTVQKLINNILTKQHIPLIVSQIEHNLPQVTYPFTFTFYLTLFLLLTFATLVMLSSCSSAKSHRILSVFSVQNSLKVYKYTSNPLSTLNGVRSLSMLWVILGHEYSTIFIIAENLTTIDDRISTYYFLLVNAGLFAVDTFFFLGGFFVAWSVLREKIQSVGKCGLAILNRWMRLVPAYLMAILIYSSMFVHFGSGPYWQISTAAVKNCDSIWRPILFVDNLVENGKNQCMDWGWYLQNDMQIFIYSIFLLMIYQKNKFAGYMALVWSVLLSFYWTFLAIYNGNYKNLTHPTDLAFQANYQEDIYIKPWSRCPPYLLGLALGMLYSEFLQAEKKGEDHLLVRWKKRMEDDRKWKWAIEALGFFLGLWLVLIPRTAQGPHYWPQLAHSLYLTYGKTLFVLSVALIILPSVLGVPSFIRTILDTKLFSFVGKASYCTYLIHLIIIMGWVGAFSTNFYFESIVQYQLFCSHTVICVFLGFLLSLLVEIPFSKLQKMLINKIQNKDKN